MDNYINLREVGVQKQFEVIMNNSLADRVDISEGITRGLEWEEAHQINNLFELYYVMYSTL